MNPSKPCYNDFENKRVNPSSDSNYGSSGSNISNNAAGIVVMNDSTERLSNSEEKHLDNLNQNPHHNTIICDIKEEKEEMKDTNVQIIEDYGAVKEVPIQQNKPNLLKPAPKLQDSLITASSPSRGSVLTNPQQPGGRFGSSLNNSNTQDTYPLKPGKAIQLFKHVLTEHEKGEILNYREIYCVGEQAAGKKVSNL